MDTPNADKANASWGESESVPPHIAGNRMNRISFDQGWHTQFLTKFQKLDGFRELTPCRVCSRYAAYAYTEIFCTCLWGAHQYGAWRAGGGGFRPARVGGGGGAGGRAPRMPGSRSSSQA